ncbi:MAG: DUF4352 domain-containing protein, partial [Cohnella sp.]|nr:DUF4352 domain-containing protein [Cohnella sp.]
MKKLGQSYTTQSESFKVGDVVKMGDYQFTVTDVSKKSKAYYTFDPSDDDYKLEFVIVSVKLENKGRNAVNYNSSDFNMATS